jgi:hypothetical protein
LCLENPEICGKEMTEKIIILWGFYNNGRTRNRRRCSGTNGCWNCC